MKKRRIGMLTFHRADNLGAVLQSYALQTVLNTEFNADAELIDYVCDKVEATRHVHVTSLKSLVKAPLLWVYYQIKHKGFAAFRKKYLKQSKNVYNKKNIASCCDDYDVFLAGSDQIWNPECSGNDDTFFLNFVESGVSASYAASIGNYHYNDKEAGKIAQMISRLSEISVRELSGQAELSRIGVHGAQVHPDPVMLLEVSDWNKVMSGRLCKDKYILVYILLDDVNVMECARAYAEAHNCKIICNKTSIEFIMHNSPHEFLSWISNAEAVFTNSFHGTAFSLVFNKPLAADIEQTDGRKNDRIYDLLIPAGAEKCIITGGTSEPKVPGVSDYLAARRAEAMTYLKNICE